MTKPGGGGGEAASGRLRYSSTTMLIANSMGTATLPPG
jgi:hypothetical protein